MSAGASLPRPYPVLCLHLRHVETYDAPLNIPKYTVTKITISNDALAINAGCPRLSPPISSQEK